MKEYYQKLPLYCQLAEEIETKIDAGEWNPGECIPSAVAKSKNYSSKK